MPDQTKEQSLPVCCPKCGAGRNPHRESMQRAFSRDYSGAVYSCRSHFRCGSAPLLESDVCLRAQLAAAQQQIEAKDKALERLRHLTDEDNFNCPACGGHHFGLVGDVYHCHSELMPDGKLAEPRLTPPPNEPWTTWPLEARPCGWSGTDYRTGPEAAVATIHENIPAVRVFWRGRFNDKLLRQSYFIGPASESPVGQSLEGVKNAMTNAFRSSYVAGYRAAFNDIRAALTNNPTTEATS